MFSERLDWQYRNVDGITENRAGTWAVKDRGGYILCNRIFDL